MVQKFYVGFGLIFLIALGGCQTSSNKSLATIKPTKLGEALWIIEGQPIEFEGVKWFPKDGTETFTELEVRQIGVYQGIPVFIDKVDIKPYERLYTKFDKYRYRYFEKQAETK